MLAVMIHPSLLLLLWCMAGACAIVGAICSYPAQRSASTEAECQLRNLVAMVGALMLLGGAHSLLGGLVG